MLPGLFWVSLVDLVGIMLGVGGWWIPGSSEMPPFQKIENYLFFLFYPEHVVTIVFINRPPLIFLLRIYFCFNVFLSEGPLENQPLLKGHPT